MYEEKTAKAQSDTSLDIKKNIYDLIFVQEEIIFYLKPQKLKIFDN